MVLVADAEGSPLLLARALAGQPVRAARRRAARRLQTPRPAPRSAHSCCATRARGGAAIWATPRLDVLHRLASGVTLLAGGRVRYSGSVEALVLRSLARSAEDVADDISRAA